MKNSYFLKRTFDYILGLIGLFFSLPFWFLFAYAIWIQDQGEIFFSQERVGLNGRVFMNIKFRSMIRDAERDTGPIQARENDPRVTKIGRWLRSTAMDELPQLWNILKGEMSFVGPRPLRPMEIEVETGKSDKITDLKYSEIRTKMVPGLTGYAQVFASRSITREEKFKYDLHYMEQQSLLLDIRLILMSFWVSLNRKWDTLGKGFKRPR